MMDNWYTVFGIPYCFKPIVPFALLSISNSSGLFVSSSSSLARSPFCRLYIVVLSR